MAAVGTRDRPARRRLLAAASELFYSDGMHATGVEAITEHAGVARKSFYNNFASKGDLELAYIEARHQEWLGLHASRGSTAESADDRVLAVFDAYLDHASDDYVNGFRGCGLLNAAAELPVGSPGRGAVRSHKAEVESILISALSDRLPREAAAVLAGHLALLLEGAMALAGLAGSVDRLVQARSIAASLLATT